jgi:hypothetical protein
MVGTFWSAITKDATRDFQIGHILPFTWELTLVLNPTSAQFAQESFPQEGISLITRKGISNWGNIVNR